MALIALVEILVEEQTVEKAFLVAREVVVAVMVAGVYYSDYRCYYFSCY